MTLAVRLKPETCLPRPNVCDANLPVCGKQADGVETLNPKPKTPPQQTTTSYVGYGTFVQQTRTPPCP